MKAVKLVSLFFIMAALITSVAAAESFKAPEFSGSVFSYFKYDLTDKEDDWQKGATTFDLDRCYLNVKGALTEKLNYRVTGDVFRDETTTYTLVEDPVNPGQYELVSASSRGKLGFGLKYAYIDVREVIPGHSIYFGMEKTPWNDFENDVWGWRVIRKVAVDQNGYLDSADLGLGVGGDLFGGVINHHLTVTNGAGYKKPESGLSGKDVDYRLTAYPLKNNETLKGLSVSAGVKAGNLGEKVADGAAKNPIMVYGGLLGFDHPMVTAGAGYFMKSQGEDDETAGTSKVDGNVISAYATGHFAVSEGMTVHPLARYDMVEPNADVDDDETTLLVAGVGLKFFGDTLALIPNYQMESYKALNANNELEDKSNNYAFVHCQWDWK